MISSNLEIDVYWCLFHVLNDIMMMMMLDFPFMFSNNDEENLTTFQGIVHYLLFWYLILSDIAQIHHISEDFVLCLCQSC